MEDWPFDAMASPIAMARARIIMSRQPDNEAEMRLARAEAISGLKRLSIKIDILAQA